MTKTLSLGLRVSLCAVWTMAVLNERHPKYSNIWAANIEGGEAVAQRIAKDLGYSYLGQLGQFKDYYELVREDHPEMSLRDSEHLTRNLLELDEVKWATQQKLVTRNTHGMSPSKENAKYNEILKILKQQVSSQRFKTSEFYGLCKPITRCIKFPTSVQNYLSSVGQDNIYFLGAFPTRPASKKTLYIYSYDVTRPIGLESRKLSTYALDYNDPLWRKQWNMQDYRTTDMPVMDLNVVPVHKMGYTGKGVVVGVVDAGVEHDNPELKSNLLTDLSYDFCNDIPGGRPEDNPHGTECAGVIAMAANNGNCGVGIAFNANIVGIRAICDSDQIESTTAKGMIQHMDKIDIYSNSWNFGTKGSLVGSLTHLEQVAYREGALKGRDGKGSIFVFSAGNDRDDDNCAVDPDINSQYTIAIAGADQYGKPAYFSERCAAVFATTYTKGFEKEGIVAPSLKGKCVTNFAGTSATCPQASGLIALVLEANPKLTYRDVMHLIAMSAEVAPLADNDGSWYKNGRGFWVSNDFGFGLMNAENMVNLALTWENVPDLHECVIEVKLDEPVPLSPSKKAKVPFRTTACEGSETDEVNYLEHVELASIVEYPYRGDIAIFLDSPSGTVSLLLEPRRRDDDKDGLEGWSILSTHNWGEDPRGKWTVHYQIPNSIRSENIGAVKGFTIKFYGTKEKPVHYNENRKYAAFRLPDGLTSEPTE